MSIQGKVDFFLSPARSVILMDLVSRDSISAWISVSQQYRMQAKNKKTHYPCIPETIYVYLWTILQPKLPSIE